MLNIFLKVYVMRIVFYDIIFFLVIVFMSLIEVGFLNDLINYILN